MNQGQPVTILLTDIEGSTKLWDREPAAMSRALERHDRIIHEAAVGAGGQLIKERGEGDSAFAVFEDPTAAVVAAIAAQRSLHAEPWPSQTPIKVRMAIHTGSPEPRGGDLYGPDVNRAARLRATGYGGQIVVSEATMALVRDRLPQGVALTDLGRHRLRDLTQPERIYQLQHPDLPASFPPLKALDAVRHNLRLQLNSFLGREAELGELVDEVRRSRLVTVTGPGGAGKTRLALHAAAALMEEMRDGVWLVELASVTDPSAVASHVAGVLRVSEEPGVALTLALQRRLAEGETLLILDNCEQVIEGVAPLVRDLVERCGGLKVLATSRQPLGIPGEVIFTVGPLSVPPPGEPSGRIDSYPATELLIDRARAFRGDLSFTDDDLAMVAEMSRRLEGLPLALELAASRVAVLGPKRSLERLDELLSAPAPRTVGVEVSHHRSLTAAIDWSFELLDDEEKRLFATLSVFSGSFTMEAVEEVVGDAVGASLDDVLASLVHKSLVVQEVSGGEPRFRMLLVVKSSAEGKLDAETATRLRARHLDRYRRLAGEAIEGLKGADVGYWLDLIAAEYEDFISAIEGASGEACLEVLVGLRRFWLLRGHWTEGLSRMRAAIDEEGIARGERWVQVAIGAGALAQAKGEFDLAEGLYRQGLEVASNEGLTEQEGYAENSMAMIALRDRRLDEARSHFERSLALLRGSAQEWATAGVLNNLGALAQSEGDLAEARRLYSEALQTARRLGDMPTAATCLNNLAEVAQGAGEVDEAARLLGESLELARSLDDRHGMALALNGSGHTELARGRVERAEELFREGIEVAAEIGDQQAVKRSLEGLARVAGARGDSARASMLQGAASQLAGPVVSEEAVIDLERDEVAFTRGTELSLDEAVAFALQPRSRSTRRR